MPDVILVTDVPTFAIVDGLLQVMLPSGDELHAFRITKHRARGAIKAATALLDEHDKRPSNVRRFARKKRGHG